MYRKQSSLTHSNGTAAPSRKSFPAHFLYTQGSGQETYAASGHHRVEILILLAVFHVLCTCFSLPCILLASGYSAILTDSAHKHAPTQIARMYTSFCCLCMLSVCVCLCHTCVQNSASSVVHAAYSTLSKYVFQQCRVPSVLHVSLSTIAQNVAPSCAVHQATVATDLQVPAACSDTQLCGKQLGLVSKYGHVGLCLLLWSTVSEKYPSVRSSSQCLPFLLHATTRCSDAPGCSTRS